MSTDIKAKNATQDFSKVPQISLTGKFLSVRFSRKFVEIEVEIVLFLVFLYSELSQPTYHKIRRSQAKKSRSVQTLYSNRGLW